MAYLDNPVVLLGKVQGFLIQSISKTSGRQADELQLFWMANWWVGSSAAS
jgi:hypothetical protein